MDKGSTHITGMGTYSYDMDLYGVQMGRRRPELLAEVIERATWDGQGKAQVRKLRKNELAAMLADFATGERINQVEAERLNAECLAATTHDEYREVQAMHGPYEYTEMLGGREMMSISKVGGGRVGEEYTGAWSYLLTNNGEVLAQGDDLRTGEMPKTHSEALDIAYGLLWASVAGEEGGE